MRLGVGPSFGVGVGRVSCVLPIICNIIGSYRIFRVLLCAGLG